jgi:hypothetical protein
MGIMVVHVYETPDLGAGTPPPAEVTGASATPPPNSTPPASGGPHAHH